MSYLSVTMRRSVWAFAAVGTFAFISTAEAQRLSRRVWDPKFNTQPNGVGLGNLGWSGEVEFEIKDACYDSIHQDGWVTNISPNCVGKLSINSASVSLYQYDNQSNKVQLSYDDSWNYSSGGNAQATLRMYVDYVSETEKNLIAVEGGFLFPEFTSAPFATAVGYDAAAYWLNFNWNTSNALRPFDFHTPITDGYAFLTSCSYRTGSAPNRNTTVAEYKKTHLDVACSQNDGETYAAILKPVPEPEAYLLGLASFGVLGIWARRRRLNAR